MKKYYFPLTPELMAKLTQEWLSSDFCMIDNKVIILKKGKERSQEKITPHATVITPFNLAVGEHCHSYIFAARLADAQRQQSSGSHCSARINK